MVGVRVGSLVLVGSVVAVSIGVVCVEAFITILVAVFDGMKFLDWFVIEEQPERKKIFNKMKHNFLVIPLLIITQIPFSLNLYAQGNLIKSN